MLKIHKFFEIGYLIVAIIFIVEAFLKFSTDKRKAGIFAIFAIMAIFMYFFKKRFRKRMENR
jgi:hypothetical protein